MNAALDGASLRLSPGEQYSTLKKMVVSEGLLQFQPLYYTYKIALAYVLFALGVVALALSDRTVFVLASAIYLGVVCAQLAFIVHDAGHLQISRETWKNYAIGLISSFFLGGSFLWWADAHNRHHSHPNQISQDPAIGHACFAYSRAQTVGKKGLMKFIVKYQGLFFFPLMAFYPYSMRVSSIKFLLRQRSALHVIECLLILFYTSFIGLILFSAMGLWQALLFIVVNQGVYGICLSFAFAPNHVGMQILSKDVRLNFLYQQVITSRNVECRPLMAWVFGGLNYQIEHHLFPRMARNNLKKSKPLIETFVKKASIPYCEVNVVQAYRDILKHLFRVSAQLKRSDRRRRMR
jgi:fatty acid desaturase